MDAGKVMWMLYENPDADFSDMSMDFMDIRKRVYTFPKMGKSLLCLSPTSSGTGSELHLPPLSQIRTPALSGCAG